MCKGIGDYMNDFEERFKKLYIKNGKRYKEYIKHKEIPHNQLYYIDGGEFVPYNSDTMDWYSYKGRPSDGVWKVYPSGATRIGDYDITDFRIELEKYRDMMLEAIDTALKNCDNKYVSRNDIVSEIFDQLDKLKQKQEKDGK